MLLLIVNITIGSIYPSLYIYLHLYINLSMKTHIQYNNQVNDKYHLRLNKSLTFSFILYWNWLDLTSNIILFSIYPQLKGTEKHLAAIYFFSFNAYRKERKRLFLLFFFCLFVCHYHQKMLHADTLIMVIYVCRTNYREGICT